MKRRVFLLLIFLPLLFLRGFAQEKIWLNEKLEEVKKSRRATYYGVRTASDTGTYYLKVYKKQNEALYFEGSYRTGKKAEADSRYGNFLYYYPNGNICEKGFFNGKKRVGIHTWYNQRGKSVQSFMYDEEGKLDGPAHYYYLGGQLRQYTEYEHGQRQGVNRYFYPNGKLYSELRFASDTICDSAYHYYPNGNFSAKTWYEKGKLSGTCQFFHENGQLSTVEYYSEKGLDSLHVYTETGEEITDTYDTAGLRFQADVLFEEEQIKEFYRTVVDELKYPGIAIENNIQGRVIIFFIITPQGDVTDMQTINIPLGYELEEAALEAAKSIKKIQSPPRSHNRRIYYVIHLPVRFQLE